jgi:ElaB/YqjD/DUF883 family membrane-anchored ribosome-binding protein
MAEQAGKTETEAERLDEDGAAVDRDFEAALSTLVGEMAALQRTLGALIDQVGRVGEAGAEAARATAAAASLDAAATRDKVTEELGGALGGLRADLARTARDHPWRTVALAAAAGIVLGLAARR